MDRVRDMQIFVRVVETGSFSAAARDLALGQPAVSKTIAALEERLGARLLVRSTRQLSATDAGLAFYERAARAIAEVNEAEAAAQGVGAGLEGRLRISSPVTKSAEKPRHSCRGWIGVGRAGLNAQEPNKTYAVPEPSMGEGTA